MLIKYCQNYGIIYSNISERIIESKMTISVSIKEVGLLQKQLFLLSLYYTVYVGIPSYEVAFE